MKEVYINDQRVDVNQNDAVDIIYDSPIFSDITKIKSNGTTTYTLPKTDHNLGIFRHADLHDVENSLGYVEMKFEEYRDGLPIIQNGRCRILKIADRIELGVVWGIKVALTELLGVKLNQITPTLKKPICRWGAEHYLKVDDPAPDDYGMLYTSQTQPLPLPCINASGILDLIGDYANMRMSYDKMKDIFKKRWIPCVTMKQNEDTIATTSVTLQNGFSLDSTLHVKFRILEQDFFGFLGKDSESSSYFDYYKAKKAGKCRIKISGRILFGEDLKSWNNNVYIVFTRQKKFENNVLPNTKDVICSRKIYDGILWMDQEVEMNEGETMYLAIYNTWYNLEGGTPTKYLEFGNGKDQIEVNLEKEPLSINITYIDRILEGGYFPIVENLPDMTCIDFIKNICQMYALFPHFNFDTKTLHFLSIDDIYDSENVKSAKNWDNKVLVEDWTIERTFGDYAQGNRFAYAEDETVQTKSEAYLILENQTLDKEKDLVELKFSATDNNFDGTIASLPFWKKKDGTTSDYELQSLKPRILGEGVKEITINDKQLFYKTLVFDSSLRFEGDKGLLKVYYDRYQGVVSKPVLREVTVMLSPVEIMQISTLDIIYLRGRYWMAQKIIVGTDGKAKVRLILLPNAFK